MHERGFTFFSCHFFFFSGRFLCVALEYVPYLPAYIALHGIAFLVLLGMRNDFLFFPFSQLLYGHMGVVLL